MNASSMMFVLLCLTCILNEREASLISEHELKLKSILRAILMDPEFSALSVRDQLKELITLYNILINDLDSLAKPILHTKRQLSSEDEKEHIWPSIIKL